jgi:hypothetical protein
LSDYKYIGDTTDGGKMFLGPVWQPARFAPREHVLKFHHTAGAGVGMHVGQIVRVIRDDHSNIALTEKYLSHLGCAGELFRIHPADVAKYWPKFQNEPLVMICEHQLFMD